jgi:23S rRNA pseudouridine2604 synthase
MQAAGCAAQPQRPSGSAPAALGPAARGKPASPGGQPALNKRMAELGLCSRREADDWIAQGWVKVNGEVAPMGLQVTPQIALRWTKSPAGLQEQRVTILLNKPIGYVSGQAEDGHSPPWR